MTATTVHLYATCWNDARQLEFFFRHYDSLVERYVIFDDGSTDGSLELLASHPRVEVRPFIWTDPDSFVLSELELFNHCWKESRGGQGRTPADWVIVCSLDEHLVHPHMREYLAGCLAAGVTVIPALGFQMFTDDFPQAGEHLCETRTLGIPDPYDCKLTLFSPVAVQEINYEPGGHVAAPVGRVVAPRRNELVLQHYQLLGKEYTLARFLELRARMGPIDRTRAWGSHYDQSREELNALWTSYHANAVDVVDRPWERCIPPEWWNQFSRI